MTTMMRRWGYYYRFEKWLRFFLYTPSPSGLMSLSLPISLYLSLALLKTQIALWTAPYTLMRFHAIIKASSCPDNWKKNRDKHHLNRITTATATAATAKEKLNQNITHMRVGEMHVNVWAFHQRYLLFNKYLLSGNKNMFRSSFPPSVRLTGSIYGFFCSGSSSNSIMTVVLWIEMHYFSDDKTPPAAAKYHICHFYCRCFCCYYSFIRIYFPIVITCSIFSTIPYKYTHTHTLVRDIPSIHCFFLVAHIQSISFSMYFSSFREFFPFNFTPLPCTIYHHWINVIISWICFFVRLFFIRSFSFFLYSFFHHYFFGAFLKAGSICQSCCSMFSFSISLSVHRIFIKNRVPENCLHKMYICTDTHDITIILY